ncbi:putative secreted protein [Mycoplana sp. BE70]|uniref:DUF1467 family protein n=1 Tax=Mycoplana sp. BE70 TaxID=2817775 RepID=UPI0028586867|nr:DUF1467 family protein [Mycoplana sp. BE70]MDR6758962.1 putative secreted protein [Mycoplana sp. BE70]
MQLFSILAVYFIIWWLTLFLVLPFGMRTQAEENDVVLGTTESAPSKFRGGKVVFTTTVVAAVIYAVWWVLSVELGYGIDAIPQFYPRFD